MEISHDLDNYIIGKMSKIKQKKNAKNRWFISFNSLKCFRVSQRKLFYATEFNVILRNANTRDSKAKNQCRSTEKVCSVRINFLRRK